MFEISNFFKFFNFICFVSQMCLVANCEASGKQDPVPAKSKPDDDDIPTNMWCDLSRFSNTVLGRYFDNQPFTLRAKGPDGKQVESFIFFLHENNIMTGWQSDTH